MSEQGEMNEPTESSMVRSRILSTGHYVPDRVVTNHDLEARMDTSDEWIRKRSGIRERRWAEEGETGADMAEAAAREALEGAGADPAEVDCIVLATLSPDHFFPGTGVFLQRQLGLSGIPCLDVRNQCTGFLYGLSVADAWIRSGAYRRVLLVGVEIHSAGLDLSTAGRDTAVLFGDGAGAAVVGPAGDGAGDDAAGAAGAGGEASGRAGDGRSRDGQRGVLSVKVHADGEHAEKLWTDAPGCAYRPFITEEMMEKRRHVPKMEGREVFKHASRRMPEAVREVLADAGETLEDVAMVIPHQANLRISKAVQKALGLPDDRVYNNIQRYGNTTAASIPIALHEAVEEGRIEDGDLVCLTAFGSGFTWGGALLRW